jgi:Zn-dependent metalloprotease
MAKKTATKKLHDNGLEVFCVHSNDASAKSTFSALKKERGSSPRFAYAAGVTAESLDPETVARAYLQQTIESDSVPSFTAPVVNKVASEFKSLGAEAIPLTDTTTVKFRQILNKVPIYGSLVTVELDDKNELLGINSSTGTPTGVSPIAKISASAAVKVIEADREYKADVTNVVPQLWYFYDLAKSKWHLAFIFEQVPVRRGEAKGLVPVLMDYVIDAHTGKLVARLPRTPTMAAASVTEVDCLGVSRSLQTETTGTRKLLKDSTLYVQTFDFKNKDPETQANSLPGSAISNPPTFSPSAVSAHANASDVSRFMRTTLMRNNIDGVGGAMISSINCIQVSESEGGLGKEWINAFWDGTQMVYGLRLNAGVVLSMSADLDVVAHEMTHGVTDMTSKLEYRFQSGALNESYSDIMGVIVNNFAKPDQSTWDWAIGAGLSKNGRPFRNFLDPAAEGQPDHMRDFVVTSRDNGGVHTNSGIHNKAAANVLVSKRGNGSFLFSPREVAIIFYLTQTQQLSRTAQFADSRRGVIQSARTFFRALPAAQLTERITAIEKAFQDVGIV